MKETFDNILAISDNRIIKTLLVILVALVAQVIVKASLKGVLHVPLGGDMFPNQKRDREKRIKTITSIITTTAVLGIWFVAIVIIMGIFNVPLAPLLTSAGLIGAGIAFGMQSLIKDFISGIFIITENQYRVDDYIQLDKVGGKVEAITVRTTVLRDADGSLHHVPNGSIGITTNLSMGPLKAREQLELAPSMSMKQFEVKLQKIAAKIEADEELRKLIKAGPELDRIVEASSKATVVSIVFTTTAAKRQKAANAVWELVKEFDVPLV